MEHREIIGFLKRRAPRAAVIFLIVFIASIGFTFLVTPGYQSDCMVMLSSSSGFSLLGGLGALKELTTFSKTGTPLDTQIELIRLTPRLMECIEKFDLRDEDDEPMKPHDFLEKIRVSLYENTDIIQIIAYDENPELARDIAQFLAENHLKIEAEKGREATRAIYSVFQEKVNTLKADLDQADIDLAAFMEREGTIDVQTEARTRVESLSNLEAEYYTARAELAGVRSRLNELQAQVDQLEPTITSATTLTQNPEILELRQNLNSAEVRLAGLLTKYTENHPDVITAREQISELMSRISEQAEKTIASEVASLNPVHQQLMREYATTAALEEGLEGQLASIKSVLDEHRDAIKGFAEKELEYLSLIRRQKVLEVIYGAARAKMEELPVSDNEDDISSAGKIIKDAQIPERPYKPNKILNATAGFILGLLLAFLFALGMEFTDKRIRGPEEVVAKLGLKHLGTLKVTGTDHEAESIYGAIIAGLSLLDQKGKNCSLLTFGDPEKGFEGFIHLLEKVKNGHPATLVALDHEPELLQPILEESSGGTDLAGSIETGKITACTHDGGFRIIAPHSPYPIDLLFGEKFASFLEKLSAEKGRSFILAPIGTHSPAATLVSIACDGVVLLIESTKTDIDSLTITVNEIKEADGKLVGFITVV